MQTSSANIYEFGEFQLDTAKRVLRRLDGTPVPLTSRVFETLLYMVEHHDAVLDKERIMEAVWPDSIVEENNLAQAISKLRQIFGETPGSHRYIVTVPGRGYRFVAEVTEKTADAPDTAATTEPKAFESVTTEAGKLSGLPARSQATRLPLQRLPAKTGWLWALAILAIVIVSLASWFFVRLTAHPVRLPRGAQFYPHR